MSGDCNVCGRTGCVEESHCPFAGERKRLSEELRTVSDRLRVCEETVDEVLNERNDAMAESASAKSVHETLVRNLTSMSEFAGKVLRERDAARAEANRLREQLASVEEERRHAVAAVSEDADRFRAERDEARREVCELRCNPPEPFIGLPHELAKVNGWDCFKEVTP